MNINVDICKLGVDCQTNTVKSNSASESSEFKDLINKSVSKKDVQNNAEVNDESTSKDANDVSVTDKSDGNACKKENLKNADDCSTDSDDSAMIQLDPNIVYVSSATADINELSSGLNDALLLENVITDFEGVAEINAIDSTLMDVDSIKADVALVNTAENTEMQMDALVPTENAELFVNPAEAYVSNDAVSMNAADDALAQQSVDVTSLADGNHNVKIEGATENIKANLNHNQSYDSDDKIAVDKIAVDEGAVDEGAVVDSDEQVTLFDELDNNQIIDDTADVYSVKAVETKDNNVAKVSDTQENAVERVDIDFTDKATAIHSFSSTATQSVEKIDTAVNVGEVESVKNQIINEIVDKFQNGVDDFEIQIAPKELGTVTVKMVVKSSELVIELVAQDAKTQNIILSSSNEIKEILQNQLNQNVTVEFVDNDSAQFNYDGSANQNDEANQNNEQNQKDNDKNNSFTSDFLSIMQSVQKNKVI